MAQTGSLVIPFTRVEVAGDPYELQDIDRRLHWLARLGVQAVNASARGDMLSPVRGIGGAALGFLLAVTAFAKRPDIETVIVSDTPLEIRHTRVLSQAAAAAFPGDMIDNTLNGSAPRIHVSWRAAERPVGDQGEIDTVSVGIPFRGDDRFTSVFVQLSGVDTPNIPRTLPELSVTAGYVRRVVGDIDFVSDVGWLDAMTAVLAPSSVS